jgi:hypothetical protein
MLDGDYFADISNPSSAAAAGGKPAAVRKGKKNARAATGFASVGQKLVNLSAKVNDLANVARDATQRADVAEEALRVTKGDLEDMHASHVVLEQRSSDLLSLLRQQSATGAPNAAGAAKKGVGAAAASSTAAAVAARLVALSEEVRVHKLASLQQKRQVQVLRQEKRLLQNMVSNIEGEVMELEEGKIIAETKNLLYEGTDDAVRSSLQRQQQQHREGSGLVSGDASGNGAKSQHRMTSSPSKLSIRTESEDGDAESPDHDYSATDEAALEQLLSMPGPRDLEEISPEELHRKLSLFGDMLARARRDASNERVRSVSLGDQVAEMRELVAERGAQVAFYEKVLAQHGLGDVLLGHPMPLKAQQQQGGNNNSSQQGQRLAYMQQDQEKMLIAANATIGSLQQLLEEKGRLIEKYRGKLEALESTAHVKSRAERHADELLERYAFEEGRLGPTRQVVDVPLPMGPGAGQLEAAHDIIRDKEQTIRQLEQRLLAESNQRERAEVRCGEALKVTDSTAPLLSCISSESSTIVWV